MQNQCARGARRLAIRLVLAAIIPLGWLLGSEVIAYGNDVPGTVVDVGTLQGGLTAPAGMPLAEMEVLFYRFELPESVTSGAGDFFQLDTLGSGFDTEIGLYDASGQQVATNDDIDPVGLFFPRESVLFFGDTAKSEGDLAAGEYYLAVGAFDVRFGLANFSVGSSSTTTGTMQVNLRLGEPVLGDLDGDYDVDFDDIDDLVLALTIPGEYETTHAVPPTLTGDIQQDGDVDFDDIPGFIAILASNPVLATAVAAVPEPPTGLLLALGFGCWALCLAGRRWPKPTRMGDL